MNNNKKAVNKNKVILNLIQDLPRLLLMSRNGTRGRFQIKFGMTSLFDNGNSGFTLIELLYPAPISRIETLRDDEARCSGFTLIELLVVVLIIGILAAVALPQYQKAVEKSRAAQAISLVKSVHQAVQTYYLATNMWPTSLDELAVDIPWTGTESAINTSCALDSRSNNMWSLELYKDSANHFGVSVGRLTGKYKGTGFMIFTEGDTPRKPGQLWCQERNTFDGDVGDYCQKIMKAGPRTNLGSNLNTFEM